MRKSNRGQRMVGHELRDAERMTYGGLAVRRVNFVTRAETLEAATNGNSNRAFRRQVAKQERRSAAGRATRRSG